MATELYQWDTSQNNWGITNALSPAQNSLNSITSINKNIEVLSPPNLLSEAEQILANEQSSLGHIFSHPFETIDNFVGKDKNGESLTDKLTPTALKSSFWTDLFLRSVVIILGFIFVAVGLTMFKADSVLTSLAPRK